MKPEDLTPEQRARLSAGCTYELIRLFCTLLIVGVFLYGLPLLGGGVATVALLVFNVLGMVLVARWLTRLIYPNEPLQELRRELEEE
jgi:Flp pilus assembly protein TadB